MIPNSNYMRITSLNREGNGTPLQYSCLENPMDGGAWWAAVHGVVKSRTQLNDFTFTFYFHALEKEMETHSSVPAWRIPGTGEPGGLLSMGSQSQTWMQRLSSSSSNQFEVKLSSLTSFWLLPKFWRKVCWRRLDSMLLIQQDFILKESTGIPTDPTGLRSQHSRKKESSRFRWHNSTMYIKLWCQILTNRCLCSIRECACMLSQVSGYLTSIQRTVELGPVGSLWFPQHHGWHWFFLNLINGDFMKYTCPK